MHSQGSVAHVNSIVKQNRTLKKHLSFDQICEVAEIERRKLYGNYIKSELLSY